jgi:uncharacterized damage-inducible protein DinB
MPDLDLFALQRLTRAANDLGHYNLGKLLQVAGAAWVNRTLYTAALPKTDRALVAEIAALEAMLLNAGLDRSLVEAIRQARDILARQQLILYRDAPPLYVCRVCGEVARDAVPEKCPNCGAGRLTFQYFLPAYYLEPVSIDLLLDQLARTPDWLEDLLRGVPAEQLTRQIDGAEGAWSLLEAAGHLLDTQHLIARRVQLFMDHESPDLAAKAMWQTVEAASLSAQEIVAQFHQSRAAMLAQLRSATPEHWARVGQHAEFGPVTLQQQCSYFAKHEQWHMAQIMRIRHALS